MSAIARLLDEDDTDEITRLLMGRRVEVVSDDTLRLDDGTVIEVRGNDGCGGCPSGYYDVSELNGVDNVITKVEYDYDPAADGEDGEGYYRIFVFADNERVNLLQFDGTDGNGYYGTGFTLWVRPA